VSAVINPLKPVYCGWNSCIHHLFCCVTVLFTDNAKLSIFLITCSADYVCGSKTQSTGPCM